MSCADALESAPGQCRLDDGGGVHCTSSSAGSHYVVYLVYEEDSVGVGLYRVQDLAQPFLEVSAELGAGHHRGQVDGDDLLVHQVEGDIPVGYPPCNAFGQGCLADSGVSDYHGVVLLPPAENLYDPVYLPVPSGHRVQGAVGGRGSEVGAESGEYLLGGLCPAAAGVPVVHVQVIFRKRVVVPVSRDGGVAVVEVQAHVQDNIGGD